MSYFWGDVNIIDFMSTTSRQYDAVIEASREIFLQKAQDYGTSWRVLRPVSVADQIYIKARRIRELQEGNQQLVSDDIPSEWKGIINYSIIGLIQLEIEDEEVENLPVEECEKLYHEKVTMAKDLMMRKNNDYGEAWREMSMESFADLILMKIYRMKQIIRNDGKTLISEGLEANYLDIINYAAFALILTHEQTEKSSVS